jgi:FlgD Ig-like domain
VRGNHEEVDGWDYDGTPNNTAIWSGRMLLKYFAPPLPDSFYSGNTDHFPDLGLPGDYWACSIGDLRIRALDPYLYSTQRPHNSHGETGGTLNGWDWKLGDQQYEWLHDDLVSNQSPYSMVAVHHLTSCYTGSGEYYGRGGIEIAKYSVAHRPSFEWGGEDSTGANVLSMRRPNWIYGAMHDMLTALGNQLVLKGHDHFHARQSLDGMLYVTLAKPDDTGEQTGDLWGWRWWSHYPDSVTTFEPNSGFLSIIVQSDHCTHAYIQTFPVSGIGTVLDSFTILPHGTVSASTLDDATRVTSIRSIAPNPARGASRIEFELGRDGAVQLGVYDVTGRLVREILRAAMASGPHVASWDGRDSSGHRVAAGVYFAKLVTRERVDAVKMIVIR